MADLAPGCTFMPRCPFAREGCEKIDMTLDAPPGAHGSACPMVEAYQEGVLT
jgi:ABC-type dipeptide/oligopeptide/nickel transport system ATPase component